MPQMEICYASDFVFMVEGVWFSQGGVGIERPFHGALLFLYSLYIEAVAETRVPRVRGHAGRVTLPNARKVLQLPYYCITIVIIKHSYGSWLRNVRIGTTTASPRTKQLTSS